MDESVDKIRLSQERLYLWKAAKPGATIAKAVLGRLVLTDHLLVFLSSGKSDLGFRLGVSAYGRRTEGLDVSALSNPGSFTLPLDKVTVTAEKKGWISKYLKVVFVDDDGAEQVVSIMTKEGGNWGQAEFAEAAKRS